MMPVPDGTNVPHAGNELTSNVLARFQRNVGATDLAPITMTANRPRVIQNRIIANQSVNDSDHIGVHRTAVNNIEFRAG
jgi:hypothetical protein